MGHSINQEKDEMVINILRTTLLDTLNDMKQKHSIAISEPVLIGDDKVGIIFYSEGRLPLFWDCPIQKLHEKIKEIPSLMEKQEIIHGQTGVIDNTEDDTAEKNIHLFAEALVHALR